MKSTAQTLPATGRNSANKRRLVLLSGLIVGIVTIALVLVSAELVLRVRWKEPYMFDRRLMFFSDGHNLQNKEWGGFTYEPNATIRGVTYYVTRLDPARVEQEYSYTFTTNSLGQVQHGELDSLKPSILFLGDSFTEGQGAEPWFYQLEDEWRSSPYQLINGGVLASGVENWGRMYKDLAGKLNIRKAVIIFIADDWHRIMWQFPEPILNCLKSSARCIGNENFYGLPADSQAASAQVDRIAKYRIRQLVAAQADSTFLQRTAVYQHLWKPMKKYLKRGEHEVLEPDAKLVQIEVSKRIVTELVNTLGRENVLFVYLPQHQELGPGPNLYARMANEFLLKSGYTLVDGRKECGLVKADYHPHDGHPNARGYSKIEACVSRATKQAFGSSPQEPNR